MGMLLLVSILVLMQPDFGTVMITVLMMWLLALTTGYSKKAIKYSGVAFVIGYLFTYLPISIIQHLPFKAYQLADFFHSITHGMIRAE